MKVIPTYQMSNKIKTCPNPKGITGICYSFDRFGDRNGCAACNCPLLTDKIYNSNGDPLPGLTSKLEKDLSKKIEKEKR